MTRIQRIVAELYHSGKIDPHEAAAILGAVETIASERTEEWIQQYGTLAELALTLLNTEEAIVR